MVLEAINAMWVERRPHLALIIGFAYTIIGIGIARLFFSSNPSIAMLFLATLLIVPMLAKLISIEEHRETTFGFRRFFKNHKAIVKIYLFLFIGIFAAFTVAGMLTEDINTTFSYQMEFLKNREGLSSELIDSFLESPFEPGFGKVLGILENNLLVIVICFLLSVFYGAGGIFLTILNASVFSSFLVFVMQKLATTAVDKVIIIAFFSIHVLPEIAGFLLAAIAGGVLSKAITTERWGTKEFRNVLHDSLALLCIAAVLVITASFLEVYVTTNLFHSYF